MSKQRRYFRSLTDLPVFLKPIRSLEQVDQPIHAAAVERLKDVSLGGVCVETALPLKLHQIVELLFVTDKSHQVQALAEVVRAERKGRLWRLGLTFISIGMREIAFIREFQTEEEIMPG